MTESEFVNICNNFFGPRGGVLYVSGDEFEYSFNYEHLTFIDGLWYYTMQSKRIVILGNKEVRLPNAREVAKAKAMGLAVKT